MFAFLPGGAYYVPRLRRQQKICRRSCEGLASTGQMKGNRKAFGLFRFSAGDLPSRPSFLVVT